jgi:HK97 family phage portal protein
MRINAETVKRIATALACVSIIGRNVGMAPAGIYTDDSKGNKITAKGHPIYDLLRTRPNETQTAFEFKQMLQGHLELRGNAYAEILPGKRGAIDQLVPMHPDRISVEMMRDTGRLRYKYNDPLTGNTRILVQEEVFHLRNFMDDGMVGQSTIALGVDVFGVALAQQDYIARFFDNNATPGGIIEGANFKNKIDEQAFVEAWQKRQTRANRHKTAVLPSGLTFKEIGVKPSDAQLLDSRKFSRIEVASIFGVPPHLIGETEKTATYASVEQFNIMFAVQCVLPRLILWEQAIQRDLILSPNYYCEFGMDFLLRGDTAARFNAYKIAIENGWLCQDEVRGKEGLNGIPDGSGKNYWRPLNWAPLGQLTNPVTAPLDSQSDSVVDTGDDTSNGPGANGRRRLLLLGAAAADRCVRKELAAVRKMLVHGVAGQAPALDQFYGEHARFMGEVLQIPSERAIAYCQKHRAALNNGGCEEFLLQLEQTGAADLAKLAVGEIQ